MQPVFIGENPPLEAVFEDTGSASCVIITHPHSLMGGNMHNNVVMAAWKTSLDKGLATLRFNFRGVGRSGGSFDEGDGEMNDLASVMGYVERPVIIIGYSFGSWVAARLVKRLESPPPCIFISPPTGMFAFPPMRGDNIWAITGDADQFCSIPTLEGLMEKDRILVVRHVDHFWFAQEDKLVPFITEKIEDIIQETSP